MAMGVRNADTRAWTCVCVERTRLKLGTRLPSDTYLDCTPHYGLALTKCMYMDAGLAKIWLLQVSSC